MPASRHVSACVTSPITTRAPAACASRAARTFFPEQIDTVGIPSPASSSRTRTGTPSSPAISTGLLHPAAILPDPSLNFGTARWDSRAVKGDGL